MAQLDIVQGGLGRIQADPRIVDRILLQNDRTLDLFDLRLGSRVNFGKRNFTRLKRQQGGAEFGDRFEDDFRKGRCIRPGVSRVRGQGHAFVGLPGGQHIGTSADDCGGQFFTQLFNRLLAQDRAGTVTDTDQPQRRGGIFQQDAAGIGAGHLDMVQRLPVIGIGRLFAIGSGQEPFKAELHILGGHLAKAAGEHLAGVQLEGDLGIADLGDGLGGIGFIVQHIGLEPGEGLATGLQQGILDRAGAVGRVK